MEELLKLLSANEIIAQIVSFLILLTLLRLFAWKKLLKLLDDRKERISLEFKKIEERNAAIDRIKDDYDSRLSSIENVAAQKLEEAILAGKKIQEEFRKSSQEEAQKIIENARQNIKYELAQAKEELKNNIVELAIGATEQIVRTKLTGEDDKKLVEDFLDDLDKAP
jgi:F-type H+-transporting ATPase subunit b